MGWVMEVGRMFMYISFPVGMFYYFNQPGNFEEWVIREKKAHFPPESKKMNKEMEDFIYDFNSRIEKQRLEAMEQGKN